ncbi:hypothetical protein PM082_008596 [Marasmius tenuissimus]|nr:hypothetical protein PM082_008596 [Marasmius tenuissimus]
MVLPLLFYAQRLQKVFVSPSSNQILTPEIDDFIEGILSSWNSPGGVSVAVVKLEEPEGPWRIETKGYGVANLDSGKRMTEDSLVCIASNSKHFTTLAAGLLIANKTLPTPITWDTKLKSILGDLWELQDPIATAQSTIIDAMSHRTGLPRHDFMYTRNDTTVSILERLRHLKPSSEFREIWQYNNEMYTLLSHLPTVLHPSRPSFARYVKEHIFDRLGLESATYSHRAARDSGNLADPLTREGVNKSEDLFARGKPRAMRYLGWFLNEDEDGNYVSGAGGIIMDARDAATWLQVLLLEGKDPRTGEEVVSRDIIRRIASGITVQKGEPYKDTVQKAFDDFQSRLVPRPSNPTPPPVPYESLSGIYSNAGYGRLELCLLGGSKQSGTCQQVIDELSTVLPGAVDSTIPTLIAKWDRFRSTHVKLEHFGGPLFNLTALESRPIDDRESDESYRTAYPLFGNVVTAQYVVNDGEDERVVGLGIFGGLWGASPLVRDSAEGGSREAAEVFFDKLN